VNLFKVESDFDKASPPYYLLPIGMWLSNCFYQDS